MHIDFALPIVRREPVPPRRLMAVLLVHSALTQALTFVLRPTISYRALELDVSAAWLGALSASFALVPLVLAVPSGQAVDRYGERQVMLAGAGVVAASGLSFVFLGDSIQGLVLGSVLLGTGHLFLVVGQQATVANTVGPGRYDTAFGYYTFAASLGQALGPGLIILIGGDRLIPDTGRIFLAVTVLAVALLVCTLLLPTLRHAAAAGRATSGRVVDLLRIPGLARALLTSCVVLAAVDITLIYLPALGEERGLKSGVIGLLLTVRAAASMATRLFLGRLSKLIGRRRLLVGSVVASAVSIAAVAIPMPVWALAIAVVALGVGLGVGQPLTMSWLAEVAPPGSRGRAMSLRLTGNRLGQVLVPSAVGLVAGGLGVAGVLWVTAAGLGWVALAARRLTV
jgi:MFS family permease